MNFSSLKCIYCLFPGLPDSDLFSALTEQLLRRFYFLCCSTHGSKLHLLHINKYQNLKCLVSFCYAILCKIIKCFRSLTKYPLHDKLKITVSNGINASLYHVNLKKTPNQRNSLPHKAKQRKSKIETLKLAISGL